MNAINGMNVQMPAMGPMDCCAEPTMSEELRSAIRELSAIENTLQEATFMVNNTQPGMDPVREPESHYEAIASMKMKIRNVAILSENLRDLLR